MPDLFGHPDPTQRPGARTDAERRRGRRKATPPRGYASRPGAGPEGETCGSCAHIVRTGRSRKRIYLKCGLMRAVWTHGPGTDIRARSPACAKWAAPTNPPPDGAAPRGSASGS